MLILQSGYLSTANVVKSSAAVSVGCKCLETVKVKVVPRPTSLVAQMPAAVMLDQMSANGQSQARAFVQTVDPAVYLIEAFEHALQLVGGIPMPVSSTLTSIKSPASCSDGHTALRRRELDGIVHQVRYHLFQPPGVSGNGGQGFGNEIDEGNPRPKRPAASAYPPQLRPRPAGPQAEDWSVTRPDSSRENSSKSSIARSEMVGLLFDRL